jgi:hypothetical protein
MGCQVGVESSKLTTVMKDKKAESAKSYDTIKLGIDAHAKWYYVARRLQVVVAVWKRRVRRRRRLRKMPRRTRGMVKTNWRWGTSWQTEVAIQSLVERTRRWWQEGQKWRPLQVKARRRSQII